VREGGNIYSLIPRPGAVVHSFLARFY